jgi:hypothetical protein
MSCIASHTTCYCIQCALWYATTAEISESQCQACHGPFHLFMLLVSEWHCQWYCCPAPPRSLSQSPCQTSVMITGFTHPTPVLCLPPAATQAPLLMSWSTWRV